MTELFTNRCVHRSFFSRLATVLCICFASTACGEQTNWPQWRGPLGTGVAPESSPPTEWSEAKNIKWKTELTGLGHSSPIVWGNQVFLTTAVPVGEKLPPKYSGAPGAHDNVAVTQRHEFVAFAVNRDDGSIAWETTLHEDLPHEGGHHSASLASASPVTDGEHVIAHFGSHGTYCLDTNGKLIWTKNFGRMRSKHGHGEGSSPAMFGAIVVVN